MKMVIKILLCFIIIIIVITFASLFCTNKRETMLMQKGGEIIAKIEEYKKRNGNLPKSLGEVGFEEYDTEEGANTLYYSLINDSVYSISFMLMSADHNKFYYSDTKQWQDGCR